MSTVWPQIGSNIDGDNPDDLFGSSISLSDDGTIVAIGAQWYDGGSITFTAATNLVTIPGHNYSDNDKIGFAGITADSGSNGIGLGDGWLAGWLAGEGRTLCCCCLLFVFRCCRV